MEPGPRSRQATAEEPVIRECRCRWPGESATIPEGLVCLSVGIEDVEDLWADRAQAPEAR